MSRVPDKYDAIQDQAITGLTNNKVTKGGDTDGATLIIGTTNAQNVNLIASNQVVANFSDLNMNIALDESITLSTTNVDFPSLVEVSLGGANMLVAKLTNPGEGTVDLPYPNYDNWMNTNSVCRKAYVDTKLPLAGGTMTGDIVMGGNDITGVTALDVKDSVAGLIVKNTADPTKELYLDLTAVPTATQQKVETQAVDGRMVLSTNGESVKFDNNSGGDQLFALNRGLGNTVGDRVTYIGGSGYPFFASQNWTNLSLVVGAISYEDFISPITVTGSATYALIPFPGTLQAGAFQVTTNSLGRLTNADGLTWAFLINFSCSITGGNGTEWEIALHINGIKVSNPYIQTVTANGRYTSLTGVWVQQLNGSVNGGVGPANQYSEIYIKRNTGSGNVSVGSAFLSASALKLQNMPP